MTAPSRSRAAAVPYLVLEHGHHPTPYQTRCHWKSRWRATLDQAIADHHQHQLARLEVRVR
jgi:hypothetical protein